MRIPTIPVQCHKDWDNMTPNSKGRHCDACCKTAIDFTNPNAFSEVKDFENVCGRFKRFIPEAIAYKPTLSQYLLSLGRSAISACLAFVAIHLLSATDGKAQALVTMESDRSGTIRVNKTRINPGATVTGRVRDKVYKEPLIGAAVFIEENDSIICGAATDIDGIYELTIPPGVLMRDSFNLKVKYIGYTVLDLKDVPLTKGKSVIDLSLMPQTHSVTMGEVRFETTPPLIDPYNTNETIINFQDLRNYRNR